MSELKIKDNAFESSVREACEFLEDESAEQQFEILVADSPRTFLVLKPIKSIGEGGFGSVILARTPEKEKYAVKLLPLSTPKSLTKENYCTLLRNELAVLSFTAKNCLPFCLSLVAYDFTDTYLRIVTKFASNGNLFDMVQNYKNGRLSQRLAKFYCAEIVVGVGHLHEHGIIHRDIAPQNILIDDFGHIMISDFGFSTNSKINRERGGLLDYNAPELLRNEAHDKSADWWSVGLTLYYMLHGKNPFWSPKLTSSDNVENILSNQVTITEKNVNSTDTTLVCFLKSMTAHDPNIRLGGKGFREVFQHSYLSGFDVDSLINKRIKPPLSRYLLNNFKCSRKREDEDHKVVSKLKGAVLEFRKPHYFEFHHNIFLPLNK